MCPPVELISPTPSPTLTEYRFTVFTKNQLISHETDKKITESMFRLVKRKEGGARAGVKGGRGSGGGLVSGVGGNGEGGGSRWAEGETLARGTGACGVRGCGVRCGLLRLIAALLLRLLGLLLRPIAAYCGCCGFMGQRHAPQLIARLQRLVGP